VVRPLRWRTRWGAGIRYQMRISSIGSPCPRGLARVITDLAWRRGPKRRSPFAPLMTISPATRLLFRITDGERRVAPCSELAGYTVLNQLGMLALIFVSYI